MAKCIVCGRELTTGDHKYMCKACFEGKQEWMEDSDAAMLAVGRMGLGELPADGTALMDMLWRAFRAGRLYEREK